MIERTVWPDSDCLARPLGGAGCAQAQHHGCERQLPCAGIVELLDDRVEVGLNCSFTIQGGSLRVIPGRPMKLIGIPFGRTVVPVIWHSVAIRIGRRARSGRSPG